MVPLMLRSCCTRVVRQDAQAGAHWKLRDRTTKIRPTGDHAVFLIGLDHDQTRYHRAGYIADNPITLIDALIGCASVPRHSHPACVANGPTLGRLVSDDRCQNTQRDIAYVTHVDPCHHQIEKDIDARAKFGHVRQVLRGVGGWGGSNADYGTGQTRFSQHGVTA